MVGGAFPVRLGRRSISQRERRESPSVQLRPIAGISGDTRHLSELRLDADLARIGSLSSGKRDANFLCFLRKMWSI